MVEAFRYDLRFKSFIMATKHESLLSRQIQSNHQANEKSNSGEFHHVKRLFLDSTQRILLKDDFNAGDSPKALLTQQDSKRRNVPQNQQMLF